MWRPDKQGYLTQWSSAQGTEGVCHLLSVSRWGALRRGGRGVRNLEKPFPTPGDSEVLGVAGRTLTQLGDICIVTLGEMLMAVDPLVTPVHFSPYGSELQWTSLICRENNHSAINILHVGYLYLADTVKFFKEISLPPLPSLPSHNYHKHWEVFVIF